MDEDLSSKMDKIMEESATASLGQKANDVGIAMTNFLKNNPEAIENYEELGRFIDTIGFHWISTLNYKVVVYGLEACIIIAQTLQGRFRDHYSAVLNIALSKIGDSKVNVREKVKDYLLTIVEIDVCHPNQLFEKLIPLLTHKNPPIREESSKRIVDILAVSKSKKLAPEVMANLIQCYFPLIYGTMREDATVVLYDLAERLGKDKVIANLTKLTPHKAYDSQMAKRAQEFIEELRNHKFDYELDEAATAQAIATTNAATATEAVKASRQSDQGTPADDVDIPDATPVVKKKLPISSIQKPKTASKVPFPAMMSKGVLSKTKATRIGEGDKYSLASGTTGDPDEKWFLATFNEVTPCQCLNKREFENFLKKIQEDLKSATENWELKVNALKRLRSAVYHMKEFEDVIPPFIKNNSLTILANMGDLRSQVIREACLAFAYICQEFKNKIDSHTCEIVVGKLLYNVMNSAKVVSTAASTCLTLMFRFVTHKGLMNEIVHALKDSKSREVRSVCCDLLFVAVNTWPSNRIETMSTVVQEGIRKGLNEGGVDSRATTRLTYWEYWRHFKDPAEILFASLDLNVQRALLAVKPAEYCTPECVPTGVTVRRHQVSSAKAGTPAPARVTSVPRPATGGGKNRDAVSTPIDKMDRTKKKLLTPDTPANDDNIPHAASVVTKKMPKSSIQKPKIASKVPGPESKVPVLKPRPGSQNETPMKPSTPHPPSAPETQKKMRSRTPTVTPTGPTGPPSTVLEEAAGIRKTDMRPRASTPHPPSAPETQKKIRSRTPTVTPTGPTGPPSTVLEEAAGIRKTDMRPRALTPHPPSAPETQKKMRSRTPTVTPTGPTGPPSTVLEEAAGIRKTDIRARALSPHPPSAPETQKKMRSRTPTVSPTGPTGPPSTVLEEAAGIRKTDMRPRALTPHPPSAPETQKKMRSRTPTVTPTGPTGPPSTVLEEAAGIRKTDMRPRALTPHPPSAPETQKKMRSRTPTVTPTGPTGPPSTVLEEAAGIRKTDIRARALSPHPPSAPETQKKMRSRTPTVSPTGPTGPPSTVLEEAAGIRKTVMRPRALTPECSLSGTTLSHRRVLRKSQAFLKEIIGLPERPLKEEFDEEPGTSQSHTPKLRPTVEVLELEEETPHEEGVPQARRPPILELPEPEGKMPHEEEIPQARRPPTVQVLEPIEEMPHEEEIPQARRPPILELPEPEGKTPHEEEIPQARRPPILERPEPEGKTPHEEEIPQARRPPILELPEPERKTPHEEEIPQARRLPKLELPEPERKTPHEEEIPQARRPPILELPEPEGKTPHKEEIPQARRPPTLQVQKEETPPARRQFSSESMDETIWDGESLRFSATLVNPPQHLSHIPTPEKSVLEHESVQSVQDFQQSLVFTRNMASSSGSTPVRTLSGAQHMITVRRAMARHNLRRLTLDDMVSEEAEETDEEEDEDMEQEPDSIRDHGQGPPELAVTPLLAFDSPPMVRRAPVELPPAELDLDENSRYTQNPSLRSNSAIDLHAIQRAKARQQYAALARQKVGSGASLPRPKKMESPGTMGPMSGSFAERPGRTRSRVAGVSHSQPSSRSGSPSSRLGYHTYQLGDHCGLHTPRSSIPRSQGASRETSPNRFGSKSSLTNLSAIKSRVGRLGMGGERPPRPVMAQKMLAQSIEAENATLHSDMYDTDGPESLGHKVPSRKTSYRSFDDHSDDSDASSICSERSFDSYRRTSDSFSWSGSQQRLYRDVWEPGVKDISEIINNCESIHWSDRKEGLVGLQNYLQQGTALTPSELKRVTDIFTRMFMDNHTKVFSLFLDTLNELIHVHRADLNSWLYVLLTRLLNKLGGDLLGSIQSKIHKSLDVVRDSFPPELQMASVLRFLTDPTQTPNLRVKTAALNFITKLAAITDPSQAFPPPSPGVKPDAVQNALHKMIGWTMGDSIKQGTELRRAAQEAILALFNLNTPQVTLRLANLPQEYQEAAASLLKGRVRRGSSSGATSSPPLSSPTPRRTPLLPRMYDQDTSPHDPPINTEEYYHSLRRTTAEIQSYSFETGREKPSDLGTTISKDSGISTLSNTDIIEEAMDNLLLDPTANNHQSRVLATRDINGLDATDNGQDAVAVDEREAMRKVVEALRSPPDSDNGENISIMSDSEKRASLGQLARLIRDSSVTLLQDNFKALLRILFGYLAEDNHTRDVQTRIIVLTALTDMVKKRALSEQFNQYVELLILKVLNCYKDGSKEVTRNAEACANTIATTLGPSYVIRTLAPLIQTGEYPLNLAALKMLTKLVDEFGRDPVFSFLPDLMPGIILAYDNTESSVRKSAVFCMVSLYTAIGESDIKPHLAALNGSKLKLLHLYIRRSQQGGGGGSAPNSPRNQPPS